MCRIPEVFSKTFEPWYIKIDETDIYLGNKKVIPLGEWKIKFVVDQDENGIFLEYYGMNSRKVHSHGRIYYDGQEQRLDVLREYIEYRPTVPGDFERGMKEFQKYNEKVINQLRAKGLL